MWTFMCKCAFILNGSVVRRIYALVAMARMIEICACNSVYALRLIQCIHCCYMFVYSNHSTKNPTTVKAESHETIKNT